MDSLKNILPRSEAVKKAEKTLQFKEKWLNKGFVQVSNSILRDVTVKPQARFVYILLMSRVFSKDFCYPGQEVLGKEIGLSSRQIIRLLKELQRHGWLEVKRRGQGKTNLYFLLKH